MFRRLRNETDKGGGDVTLTIDGKPVSTRSDDSVAAAALASGVVRFRTSTVSGEPRGPYCMMGVCFECLLTIDGKSNQQACMVKVRPGMRVKTQSGRPSVAP
jgi:predicted molibdopterin-dependent oxidoreductase YjgC